MKENRSDCITSRTTPTLKKLLKAEADKDGRSLNDYVNRVLEAYILKLRKKK